MPIAAKIYLWVEMNTIRTTFFFATLLAFGACRAPLRALDFWAKNKPVALVFLAAECPISQKYVLTINELVQKNPDVAFVGVFTRWDDAAAIEQFERAFQPQFPLHRDGQNRWVRHLGAGITPEVFLLDRGRTLRYRGAVDNWFFALGQHRPKATERFLADAIRAVLAGQPVAVPRTEAVGCRIER
jgi:thiol-disulfide isomerase/thioredoxin